MISLPLLPKSTVKPGSVWAVTMVRNEEDIIAHSIRHLLNQGIEGVIVSENLSDDGTEAILDEMSRNDSRIHVAKDRSTAFYQGRKISYLANLAHRAGAEWVVLFDADEFWFAENTTVAEYLRSLGQKHKVVEALTYDSHATSVDGISMDSSGTTIRIESEPNMKKVAIRPNGWAWISDGNHDALDLGQASDSGLRIAHLPRRTFAQFERKVVQGANAIRQGRDLPDSFAFHWKASADAGHDSRFQQWSDEIAHAEGDIVSLPIEWQNWSRRN